jgi:catechol 2,3-dioxygenase-like lactoylglutathione lyase family enzyme
MADIALPFPTSLCHGCRHLRMVGNNRGSRFLRCGEPSLPRYPLQPIESCAGFTPGPEASTTKVGLPGDLGFGRGRWSRAARKASPGDHAGEGVGGLKDRGADMGGYVHPTEQLVTEIVVTDIGRSAAFYRALGFKLLRDGGDFMELTWEDHRLFLAEPAAFHDINGAAMSARPAFPIANVRVMVPNVDDYWKLANEIGAPVIVPIADRYYGLRDFTIADPDGFGVRFASLLQSR